MVPVAVRYLLASLSSQTRKIYAQALLALKMYAQSNFQGQWFPTPVSVLAIYISDMLNNHKSVSTVLTSLSAISFFHKLFDLGDPPSHFVIKRIVSGAQKISHPVDTRLPISIHVLHQLVQSCEHVTPSSYHAIMLKAMYLFMFHAFLRVGEVTQSINVITFDNVTVHQDRLTIRFIKFKHHTGPTVSIDVPSSNSPYCPVKAIHDYTLVRGSSPGPMFLLPNNVHLSPRLFSSLLSSSLSWCNLAGANIKPHSFRIGAATFAASQGYTSSQIRAMGRWNSNAFEKYIRISAFKTF